LAVDGVGADADSGRLSALAHDRGADHADADHSSAYRRIPDDAPTDVRKTHHIPPDV